MPIEINNCAECGKFPSVRTDADGEPELYCRRCEDLLDDPDIWWAANLWNKNNPEMVFPPGNEFGDMIYRQQRDLMEFMIARGIVPERRRDLMNKTDA